MRERGKKAQTERKNTNILSQFAIVWQAAPVSNGATHGRLARMYLSFRQVIVFSSKPMD